MTQQRRGSFRFAFTAAACLLLLPLKMIRGREALPAVVLASSWVADSCFLFLLCALSIWAGGTRLSRRVLLGGLVFAGLELPVLLAITAQSYFLDEATLRLFSLLDATPSAVRYFLVHVVERHVLWTCLAALAAVAAASFVVSRRIGLPAAKPALAALAVLSGAVLVHQARCELYPSVLWMLGRDVREAFSHPPVAGEAYSKDLEDAGAGRAPVWPERSPFDKVIVFVMESVPLRELEAHMSGLPADHFFNRERRHTHSYRDYFTTNQDSRTGIISMLFSRLVPFEAYSEADELRYAFLKEERSLVDEMGARGYRTALAASQIDEEVIVYELPSWQDRLLLSEDEYERHGGFLCFNPYEFEKDCEDKILLPRIFTELESHRRLFLFQEAVVGHNTQYDEAMRKSPVQYYGEYLQAIADRLAARGELDRTLIVVTSDHGIRSTEESTRRWSYRLPLLFISPRFDREDRDGLYGESDFAALLAAEMAGDRPPPPRTASLFVGWTHSALIGSITADGDLLVVKDRGWRKYVMAEGYCPGDEAPAGKPRRPVSSAALVDTFQRLRDAFQPRSGPSHSAQTTAGQR